MSSTSTPFPLRDGNATVTINSESKLAAHIKIYNQFGLQLQHLQRPLIAGSNNIPITGIGNLPAGAYIIVVEDEQFNKIGTSNSSNSNLLSL